MTRRVNIQLLSDAEMRFLEQKRVAAEDRRKRNAAAVPRRCINDNKSGTHGVATHGVRCARCYQVHKGKPGVEARP